MTQPQAKNELGQLFIDFGTKGVPTLLKSLNTVSAQFLLGKNAANQFVQTLTKPFKEAGNSAIEIGKMSNALATSSLEYQKLSMYLKKYNISESILGDVEKLEDFFTRLGEGRENIGGLFGNAMSQLGLDFNKYNGSFKDIMILIDDIQKATAGMSKKRRNMFLKDLGLSKDWGYLFDKGGRATDFATISDEAVKANMSLQESLNNLKNTAEVFKQELLSKIAPSLTKIADFLSKWIGDSVKEGKIDKVINNTIDKTINTSEVSPAGIASKITKNGIQFANKIKGQTTGQAADMGYLGDLPDITKGAELHPNISSMSQNITNNISHDITINGNNANEIASKIAAISSQDIQYTQYQANNLAGI